MARQPKITSITESKVDAFLRTAKQRGEALTCDLIRGFFLMKTQRGAAWRYRYTDANGKRRTATIEPYHPARKPQQVAEKALAWRLSKADPLAEKAATKAERRDAARASKARTLRAYLDGLYARYQGTKKSGKETLDRIRHGFPELLDRDMASLTKHDILTWNAEAQAKGLAYSTRIRTYGALKTCLGHAVKEDEVLRVHPLAKVTLPRPGAEETAAMHDPEAAAHRRLLTADELAGIQTGLAKFAEEIRRQRRNSRTHGKEHLPDLDAVDYPHWFIPFCLVALHTGMRPGDLYTLKWTHLDMQFSKTLRKTPEKTMHHRAPAVITLPLSEELHGILTRWHEQQGKPNIGWVFPSPVTGKPMDGKAHGNPWRQVLKAGGLPETLHFYSLRHHFISTLVASGVPLLTVAQMVGHKSVAMIEAHYGHLCKHTAAAAMQAFSASLTSAQAVEGRAQR